MNKIMLLVILIPFLGKAQTCCSAGTPILSSLEIASINQNQIQISYSYNRNIIKDVFDGKSKIEATRQRISSSNLFAISYGLNKRWSFNTIFSFVEHSRELVSPNTFGSREKLTTNGLGDLMFITRYNMIVNNIIDQRELSISAGFKAPTGKSTLNNNGILLPADMQSGTGSWDAVAILSFSQGIMPIFNGTIFSNLSYRFNGQNDRFQTGDGYKFGNIFTVKSGISHKFFTWIDASIQFTYRNRQKDVFNKNEVANTGGEWAYLDAAINLNFDPFGLRISGQNPVYRNLKGIQLTTTNTYTLSIYYTFIWGE